MSSSTTARPATAPARHNIVFVHLGAALPPWAYATMVQATLFNACPIFMIAGAAALQPGSLPPGVRGIALEELGVSDMQRAFREIAPLDRTFRDGFWAYTTERFFVLENAMWKLGWSNVLHLENDMLLYADLDQLGPKLAALYPGIAATFDNDQRCIPGLVHIATTRALSMLSQFILAVMDDARRQPPGQSPVPNDMLLFAIWRRSRPPQEMDALPVVPSGYPAQLRSAIGAVAAAPTLYSRHFSELGMVFDAAALGQYLGGIDARNDVSSRGFINEDALYDPRVLRPRLVVGADGLKRPIIETTVGTWPVANLHIHSKQMQDFLSRPL